ncbi:hypothetical protein BV898_09310 [Hypsibius exemplaris]|uniref:Uncharacterized protein n=1 Tax=Hypsibius exemplaris TaxID=2072580 RepID=A0A1W0WN47_HYPEX|nr:hypothetical protein BV898_09310 [Hypsibius exemplaris]
MGIFLRNLFPYSGQAQQRSSPESASGDGDGEDAAFSSIPPIRPRTSSLQSKPGRGIGKRAHFEDEVTGSSSSTTTPSTPLPSPLSPPVLSTPSPTPTEGVSTPTEGVSGEEMRKRQAAILVEGVSTPTEGVSGEEMRKRQAAILVERRRMLQERLQSTTPVAAATPVAFGAMASTDVARLERAITMLRQILLIVLFSILFLVLRRFVTDFEEEEFEEF